MTQILLLIICALAFLVLLVVTGGFYFLCLAFYFIIDLIKKLPNIYKVVIISAIIAYIAYYITMR